MQGASTLGLRISMSMSFRACWMEGNRMKTRVKEAKLVLWKSMTAHLKP